MATITGTFNSLIAGTISGSVATPGATGPAGPTGATGATGPAGPGVPSGGLTGQVLLKVSETSYDTAWFDNYAATVQATVRNETGSTLTKGTVVYISGGAGNKPLVTKASASTEASSSKTFAILAENISTNNNGQAVTMGLLKGLDTSAFTAGANLWLSTTAGQIVSPTPPASPAHAVFLGNVVRVHATQGEIEVRIQNGLELGELHDVLIDTPANGQVLKYDSAQGLWINGTDSSGVAWGAITGTLSSQTDLQTALDGKYSTSNPSGYITSSALSPYLTSATAASTYQPLSGMSSYLTTSSAASTYQTISGMSSYLTTSAAASTYLTQSNAASTYQTQAGMTNYLSKAGNLSGLASTSTARTNLGLGTLSTVNDAPADGSQYARKNNSWEVVSGGGGGATWGSITGTLSSQTDLDSVLNNKASLSGATFGGAVSAPTPTGIANDGEVINRAFSEQNLGFNWADLLSTKIYNLSFFLVATGPEDPTMQQMSFDMCCPEGFNNIRAVDGSYPSIQFLIKNTSGVTVLGFPVSFPMTSVTNQPNNFTTLEGGLSCKVYLSVQLYSGGPEQISRFHLATVTT